MGADWGLVAKSIGRPMWWLVNLEELRPVVIVEGNTGKPYDGCNRSKFFFFITPYRSNLFDPLAMPLYRDEGHMYIQSMTYYEPQNSCTA